MSHTKGFLPVLLFIIAIAGGYFLTYKQWSNLSVNKSELTAVKEQNETLLESKRQMTSFLSQYNSMVEEQKKTDKIVPVKKTDIDNFVNNLSKYSQESAVFVKGVSFTESKIKPSPNGLTYLDTKITAAGTYPSLKAFIDAMETNLRIVDIMTISAGLAGEDDATSGDLMEYLINARIYYQN